ncbi:uncharacterized protein LOC128369698 [Scomber scombrus]|uniref:Uncharacterized protein LOC128369698 n=1 Tax=Scomber scombrus TaxID=13677 RepID=A0AAV1Q3D8_SCOSC
MALAALLFAVCVLYSWETQGSSAVTTVFVQKGKDLHLDVNKPVVIPESDEFRWRFNTTHSLVRLFPDKRTRIVDPYKGRVEFSVQNHSLLLKNVQHSDSGDYTALITGDTNQPLTEYKVIIQDPVSPVQLSVNVSNSRESCNLTVTCSTEDSLISSTFRCDTHICNQEGGEQSEVTTSGSSLRVYLFNDSIICNHSNQVSWTSNMTEIRPLCSLNGGINLVIPIGIGAAVLFGLFLGCLVIYKRKKCGNTEYSAMDVNLNQTPNQNSTEDASGLFTNTYALAGFPTAPAQSETVNTPEPETEAPKSDHQPELKNTEKNNDSVHSQDKIIIYRSSAVTTVFVQKGKNLHLDVNKPVVLGKYDEFRWRFNDTHSIVRLFPDKPLRIVDPYEGRVEFSVQSHSLFLKNVQHSDSGDYTALLTGDKNQPLAEYKVIIQDPVSPVQLSVKSVSNSRESCNLTVTCSTEDSLISSTFRCDNQTCNQEGGEQSENTTSGSSLRVYLFNDSIICNHSNQVSWTRDMKEIWPLCSLTAVPTVIVIVIVIVIMAFIFLVCIIIYLHKRKKIKNWENTVYDSPQNTTGDASVLSPSTTYASVHFPTRPKRSTETKKITLPETIYSEVNRGPKSNEHLN